MRDLQKSKKTLATERSWGKIVWKHHRNRAEISQTFCMLWMLIITEKKNLAQKGLWKLLKTIVVFAFASQWRTTSGWRSRIHDRKKDKEQETKLLWGYAVQNENESFWLCNIQIIAIEQGQCVHPEQRMLEGDLPVSHEIGLKLYYICVSLYDI